MKTGLIIKPLKPKPERISQVVNLDFDSASEKFPKFPVLTNISSGATIYACNIFMLQIEAPTILKPLKKSLCFLVSLAYRTTSGLS